MSKASQNKLSPLILDEVWTLMKYATETKDKKISPDDEFVKTMPDHFRWECCVIDSGDEASQDSQSQTEASDEDGDKVVCDSASSNKDQPIQEAADLLVQMGDTYCKEKGDEAKLIQDIKEHLLSLSVKIDDKIARQLCTTRPSEELFQTGLLSIAYSTFRSKLQNFLGLNDSVDKIAIVTHVARGVASSLRDSNLPAMQLVSVLAYKFVSDRYQHVLQEHGSVTELAKSMKESEPQRT